jgi:ABC-type sugar transport system substrate-binding protein
MIDHTVRRAARLLILALVSATVIAFAQDAPRVAFVPQLVGIPYFNAMEEGGNAAAERFGVTFIYTGPTDTNPTDQLRIVNSLIDQGVEAISLAVLDASGIDPLVDRANERGLVLFTSDSDAPDSRRAIFVAQASDEGLGYGLIDELVAQIGGSGKIGIVSGEATATNLNTWISHMQARVEERYPDVELLEPRFAGGTAQRAFQIADDLMTAHPDLKGLIAVASTTCPGVGQAIESAGRIGEVIGTGYCSPNTARSYIKSGAFGFTVLWDPAELGYLTVWAGLQLITGDGFQAVNEVPGIDRPIEFFEDTGVLLLGPPAIFTVDNVDDFDF